MPELYMAFDVESVGLHGEGFAYGFVVVDQDGYERGSGQVSTPPDGARGDDAGRAWVAAHITAVPAVVQTFHWAAESPVVLRRYFWRAWRQWADRGAVLVADCAWPVEARFLAACVDDEPAEREWRGPYPLHEVATARMLAGFDPLATVERLPHELPQHNPLADARQSARLWLEALTAIRAGRRPEPGG